MRDSVLLVNAKLTLITQRKIQTGIYELHFFFPGRKLPYSLKFLSYGIWLPEGWKETIWLCWIMLNCWGWLLGAREGLSGVSDASWKENVMETGDLVLGLVGCSLFNKIFNLKNICAFRSINIHLNFSVSGWSYVLETIKLQVCDTRHKC